MQGLVYTFIAVAALGLGATAYFGLSFTPIEAFVMALAAGALAVVFVERQLRQRSEARLQKGIEELSRLLATDAQAGNVLSQRVNALVDENTGKRIEGLEADLSVLGTAVRQVAAAVVDLEEVTRSRDGAPTAQADDDAFPEPVIPIDTLRRALDEGRIICHIEAVTRLPSRLAHAYDVVPRLVQDDGDLSDPPDFLPRGGGADLLVRVERLAHEEGVAIARRSVTARQPVSLYLPISRATLGSSDAMEHLLGLLDDTRSVSGLVQFALPGREWPELVAPERAAIGNLARRGIGFSLVDSPSLRLDFGDLQGLGFRSIRVDASRFIGRPDQFTDFHISDVADYARRYGIELIATGVTSGQQLPALQDAGITLVQGPLLGAPHPPRADTVARPGVAQRRA